MRFVVKLPLEQLCARRFTRYDGELVSDVIGGDVAVKDFPGDGSRLMVFMGVELKEDPAWGSGQYCRMEIGIACKGYIAGGNNCHGDFEWL